MRAVHNQQTIVMEGKDMNFAEKKVDTRGQTIIERVLELNAEVDKILTGIERNLGTDLAGYKAHSETYSRIQRDLRAFIAKNGITSKRLRMFDILCNSLEIIREAHESGSLAFNETIEFYRSHFASECESVVEREQKLE